jgi:gephyrin
VEKALHLIKEHSLKPLETKMPVNIDVVGHVLAEDVRAQESVPAFRASIVDGYAVRFPASGQLQKGVYPVSIISHAQASAIPELMEGQLARITTGAPLPPGSSAVVMVEDTVLKSMTDDGKEEKEVEILTSAITDGENVREIGSDVRQGDIVLRKGDVISAIGGEFGLIASVGVQEVSVYRKPVVGILSTGDELVSHNSPTALRSGEVRDTNRPTLLTAVKSTGFQAVDLGIASDQYVSGCVPCSYLSKQDRGILRRS